jgi:hypothetical protein
MKTNLVLEWNLFDNQQYGSSFDYTFNNPGVYLLRLHPSACNLSGYDWTSFADARVEVLPNSAGSLPADQWVCAGTPASEIVPSAPFYGYGSYSFLWQQSTDNGLTWSDAPGTNNGETYTPVSITEETLFKRIVTDGCGTQTEGNLVSWAWSTGGPDYPVVPTNRNKVFIERHSVNKVSEWWGGVPGWGADAGAAISAESITNNGGYVEAIVEYTNKYAMLGLSNYNTDPDFTSIQYAIYPVAWGILQIYESGVYRGDFGPYNVGDRLRVSVENNQVKYYRNGTLLYTSTVAPTFPLHADVSIYSPSGGFKYVRVFNPVKAIAVDAPQRVAANIVAGPVFGAGALMPDASITAFTCWDGCAAGGHESWRGRLFNKEPFSMAWASGTNFLDGTEYLQFDLGTIKPVSGIYTQSRGIDAGGCCAQRVTSYTVSYSEDGSTWFSVPGTFTGNSDNVTVVLNTFAEVEARFVRIYPTGFFGHMSIRADVLSVPKACNSVHLSAEIPRNATTLRWYDSPSGGTLLHTGQFFTTPTLSENTTYYIAGYNATEDCESVLRTAIVAQVSSTLAENVVFSRWNNGSGCYRKVY